MIHYTYEVVKRKRIGFCEAAKEEYKDLPYQVSEKFEAILILLEKEGQLREPYGKKLANTGLFEIRVRVQGQWRCLYAYYLEDMILILRIFQKKTQKTPANEINTALKRLNNL
jgi:phage-related protein